jgi:putative membrane protein
MKSNNPFKVLMTGAIACAVMFSIPAFAQENNKLSDAEVASVAVTANQIDIDYAAIAKQKSKNANILKFAETMASDHKAIIDQAVALVTKLKVTPKDNAVSQKLRADAVKTKKMLRSKSGNAFNKAYIDNEVAYHKAVINAVENLLIPDASNTELKALLQNVLPILKTHLEHAIMVQKKISK